MHCSRRLLLTKSLINNTWISRRFSSPFKTGFDILGEESDPFTSSPLTRTRVTGYEDHAFSVNDVLVKSSVIVLPKHYFKWNVTTFKDITIESLAVFPFLIPTIEVLLVGCGENMPERLSPDLIKFFKSKGIYVEAVSTLFNFKSFSS